MPTFRKTVTVQDVRFVIESEKSVEFVDRWLRFLKDAPKPITEQRVEENDDEV